MKRKPKPAGPRPADPQDYAEACLRRLYDASVTVRKAYRWEALLEVFRKSTVDPAKLAAATEYEIERNVGAWFFLGPQFVAVMQPIARCREEYGYDPRYQNPDTTPRKDGRGK